uniref:Uncharacterized protein n=1 Tax=Arundo donax TaxID=35708 RepID=A0A0A9HRM1_ARUDO
MLVFVIYLHFSCKQEQPSSKPTESKIPLISTQTSRTASKN